MVIIHSISLDNSTNDVIEWLSYYKKKFVRINSDFGYKFKVQEDIFIEEYNSKEFFSYWYRRGIFYGLSCPEVKNSQPQFFLEENQNKIIQYIEEKLCEKKYLNKYFNSNLNKLLVLEKSKKIGLKVPFFILTDNLNDESRKYIYKPINEGGNVELKDFTASAYTELYKSEKESYGLTFFQELIEKKYELRIFYLDGRFYSMAIFSQKDEQTKVDFRHYNKEKPNRTVPFQLPEEIENKLDSLMKELDLKSGSIDMIVSKENEYYFLEVNPVGQFGMVSYPCNYHLEKEIAEYLSYD